MQRNKFIFKGGIHLKITGSSHATTGNFGAMKEAHLRHDKDKRNDNLDIDYDLSYLNTHHTHVEDFDTFYDEKYEQPIRNVNEKHKARRQYKRMFKDFDEYKEKQINSGRRKIKDKNGKETISKTPKDPNRLLMMRYGGYDEQQMIVQAMVEKSKGTIEKEDVLRAFAQGLDNHVNAFNEKHEHLTITEHSTHVDEGSPHVHANLWAHGTDRYGKPFYDVNQSLKQEYGSKAIRTTKDGKTKQYNKSSRDLWKDFRDDVDRSVVSHVNDSLVELAKSKGIEFTPPEFVRKESEDVGRSHEQVKQEKKNAELRNINDDLKNEIVYHGAKADVLEERHERLMYHEDELEQREHQLSNRERALNRRENELNEREMVLDEREESLDIDEMRLQDGLRDVKARNRALDDRERELKHYDDVDGMINHYGSLVYHAYKENTNGEGANIVRHLDRLEDMRLQRSREDYRSRIKSSPSKSEEKDFGPEL